MKSKFKKHVAASWQTALQSSADAHGPPGDHPGIPHHFQRNRLADADWFMHTQLFPVNRPFDGRMVWQWQLLDDRQRVRGNGVELSEAAAKQAAGRALRDQGPGLLLDMLECRGR